jgi:hypothetical protein
MAIDGQQEIGDKFGRGLDHQAVLAPCDKMIDFEMSLPPSKKLLKASGIHSLEKGTLGITFFRGDRHSGKIIFFQGLNRWPS